MKAYYRAVQVLGSLLPGVREVRAPLAAGYTWLLVAWLLYGSDASQHPSGLAVDLKRLHETVSSAGAAVAVGFVASHRGCIFDRPHRGSCPVDHPLDQPACGRLDTAEPIFDAMVEFAMVVL